MKVLVTGVGGQLGYDVVNELSKRGYETIGSDIKGYNDLTNKPNCRYVQLDITDREQVREIILSYEPDAIIHCAAWTNVDEAELSDNKEIVRKINVDGTKNLVWGCEGTDRKFIYISTDYVFDGQGTQPWKPDDKNYNPQNFYGFTKLDGDCSYCLGVRIKWKKFHQNNAFFSRQRI